MPTWQGKIEVLFLQNHPKTCFFYINSNPQVFYSFAALKTGYDFNR